MREWRVVDGMEKVRGEGMARDGRRDEARCGGGRWSCVADGVDGRSERGIFASVVTLTIHSRTCSTRIHGWPVH